MILQSLVDYYNVMVERGEIAPPGWAQAKISYALNLDENGALTSVSSLLVLEEGAKKPHPQYINMPAPQARGSNITPNFLWDNSTYLLGIDAKGKPDRSLDCFVAAKKFHKDLLGTLDNPAAKSIVKYFETWDAESARAHPALQEHLSDILAGGNLMLCPMGLFPQEEQDIRKAWQNWYDKSTSVGTEGVDLVTGERGVICRSHPKIMGIRGGQASGSRLVSFNAPSLCSFGKEGGYNAPVSEQSAFAYTAALNYLLSSRKSSYALGKDTVVFWSADGDPAYQDLAGDALFGGDNAGMDEQTLLDTVRALANGKPAGGLDADKTFYLLGLAPTQGRDTVKFFYQDTFGALMKHVEEHSVRLDIEKPPKDTRAALSLYSLLCETVPEKQRDDPNPMLKRDLARAVLSGGRYPASLIEQAIHRIHTERKVSRGKAAIIKAYYLRNPHTGCPKELLTYGMNEETNNAPYVLGRLFRLYEAAQLAALDYVNASIRDRCFSAAAMTPAAVFPQLMRLNRAHLKKLSHKKPGLDRYYESQILELTAKLGPELPKRLDLAEQGAFCLGYYHQERKLFTKKTENNTDNKEDTTNVD